MLEVSASARARARAPNNSIYAVVAGAPGVEWNVYASARAHTYVCAYMYAE